MEENNNCSLFSYRPKAVLRVSGEDAATFLQGQFSNDLQKEIGSVTYGLWLNQKGKVLADSQVMRLGHHEFLVVSKGVDAAIIRQRLEQYVIADDVLSCDETEKFFGLALWGEGAEGALRSLWGELPPENFFVEKDGAWLFAERRTNGRDFELLGSLEKLAGWRERMERVGFVAVSVVEAESARIRAGVPAIPVDIGLGDLPNEGGLETWAISFTKGCYLGQEVMARLKNLGQVRRRLHVVRGVGQPPVSLAALYQGDLKVGEVRSVVVEGDGFLALAMLSLVNFKPELDLSLASDQPAHVRLYTHG